MKWVGAERVAAGGWIGYTMSPAGQGPAGTTLRIMLGATPTMLGSTPTTLRITLGTTPTMPGSTPTTLRITLGTTPTMLSSTPTTPRIQWGLIWGRWMPAKPQPLRFTPLT